MDGIRSPKKKRRRQTKGGGYPDLSSIVGIVGAIRRVIPLRSSSTGPAGVSVVATVSRRAKWPRRVAVSLFALFVIAGVGLYAPAKTTLNARTSLSNSAQEAVLAITEASTALAAKEYDAASAEFENAQSIFLQMEDNISELPVLAHIASSVWPGHPVSSGSNLAAAGSALSSAGGSAVDILEAFDGTEWSLLAPPDSRSSDPVNEGTKTIAQSLALAGPSYDALLNDVQVAADFLHDVDLSIVPAEYRTTLEPLVRDLPEIALELGHFSGLLSTLADLAGIEQARHFLFVFQNPNELRPTGGFMGQSALVKIQNGIVEQLRVMPIYDADGQVKTRRTAPDGLNVVSDTFSLRDANWFPDFSKSAESIADFLRETGDPKIDGVIALNAPAITELLILTGPIFLPELELLVSSDNFIDEAQYEVPKKQENRDRTFFSSLTDALFSAVFELDSASWPLVAEVVTDAILSKDIQVHFIDESAQNVARNAALTAELPAAGVDLLAHVSANIGGGKSDQFITEQRALRITEQDQSFRHELSIWRTLSEEDPIAADNRSYMRFYVPSQSTVVQASGFDTGNPDLLAYACENCVSDPRLAPSLSAAWDQATGLRTYQEGDWTVFAGWVTLEPGTQRTIKITYDVPRSSILGDQDNVKVYLWRQPGTPNIKTDVSAYGADGNPQTLVAPEAGAVSGQGFNAVLDRDRVIGILTP